MRKKLVAVLILALSVILMLSLVACNSASQNIDELPDEINANKVNQGDNNSKINAYLRFYMPDKVSSVFSSIYVDEFDVSDVKYSIVYTDGTTTTEVNGGNLTLTMINADDRALLEKAGHHQIRVATTLANGTEVTGSFALHLKERYVETPQVTVTVVLGDENAQAYFGTVSGGKAVVSIDKDISFNSWDSFTDSFKMACEGKALDYVTVNGTRIDFSKGYTISKDTTFTAHWTDNVISAKFHLNVPTDATVMAGKNNAVIENDAGVDVSTQSVVRNLGKIQQPLVDKFNVFNGYYFSGWYKDVNGNNKYDSADIFWNFSQRVGSEDVNLVARWTDRSYSFTLYTMGGSYPSGVTNSVVNGTSITSDEVATSLGYRVVEANSRFGLDDGELNRIVITGFVYGTQYRDYIVKVRTSASSEQTTYLTFDDMLNKLVKGNASYVVNEGIYRDYQCTQEADVVEIKADETGLLDDIGYIKWVFNEPEKPSSDASAEEIAQYKKERLERMSKYYLEVVFKNSLTKKPDGSLRIDRIDDESVSGLIIPATLLIDGIEYPITEISAKSCMNLKALLTLDLSEATNLVSIGEQAFAHCPVLSTVVLPTNSKIQEVGANIFYRSTFENEYHKNTNNDFIVINNILYKYVGEENEHTKVDLSSLDGVTIIAGGAFENRTDVQKVVLGNNIQSIQNGAFKGCSNLENIEVNAKESSLKYIGETAFDGCDKLISTENKNVYLDEYKAVIIGRVYYRMLDKSATSATIPTNTSNQVYVEYIAPYAFDGCNKLSDINIFFKDTIKGIGKDAFNSTVWVTKSEFSIINGMLAAYYTTGVNAKADIEIPEDTANLTIIERAFGSFANQIATIQFGSNVKMIENYAFSGANALVSLIFPEVTINDGKIVGAPSIGDYAFAGTDGELLDYVKFYFKDTVIEFLQAKKGGTSDDAVTATWLQLYNQYPDRFVVEDIEEVRIDSNVISNIILKSNADATLLQTLINKHGKTVNGVVLVEDALRVKDNAGIEYSADLVLSGEGSNNVQFVPISEGSAFYQEGLNRYLVTFEYNNSVKGCQNSENSDRPFILTVVDAIAGNPSKTEVVKVDGNTKDNSNYWIEGFEGQVAGELTPTFYTSCDGVSVKFGYKDINGIVHYIDLANKNISGFTTNVETTTPATAVFTVNFNDICTYKFSINYTVKTSKYAAIEQISAVSIPINGNATTYFYNFTVNLVGQDGYATQKKLSKSEFSVIEVDGVKTDVVNTASLGLHTMKIQYNKTDAVGTLEADILYTVVLQADSTMFTYSLNYADMTAKITSCVANKLETIVIPSVYTEYSYDSDGKIVSSIEFKVTAIGEGVFRNKTSLKAIYLGENIKTIGTSAFEGCTALENVYTIKVVQVENASLASNNFSEVNNRTYKNEYTEQEEYTTTVTKDGQQVENTVMLPLKVTENVTVIEVTVSDLTGISHTNGVISIAPEYTTEQIGAKVPVMEEKELDDESVEEVLVGFAQTINRTIYQVVGIGNVTLPAGTTQLFLPDTMYMFGKFAVESASEENDGIETASVDASFEFHIYNSSNGIRYTTESYVNNNLETIGNSAFKGCTSLATIDLSQATKLSYIGPMAFHSTGLTSIDLSNNTALETIDAQVFENCTSLESVTISSSVKAISTAAFKGCTELAQVVFSDQNGLANVASDAFDKCDKEGFVAPTVAPID